MDNIVSKHQLGSFLVAGMSKSEITSKLITRGDVVCNLIVLAVSAVGRTNVDYSRLIHKSVIQHDISLLDSKESIVI